MPVPSVASIHREITVCVLVSAQTASTRCHPPMLPALATKAQERETLNPKRKAYQQHGLPGLQPPAGGQPVGQGVGALSDDTTHALQSTFPQQLFLHVSYPACPSGTSTALRSPPPVGDGCLTTLPAISLPWTIGEV